MGLLHCEEGTADSLPHTQNITGSWKYALQIGRDYAILEVKVVNFIGIVPWKSRVLMSFAKRWAVHINSSFFHFQER
jgi:hypothetical protein